MKTIFIILGVLILSVFVYLGFYNAFYSPKFELSDEGGETIVYQAVNDRYQLTDSFMKQVFNELYEKNGIVITKGIGLHEYDPALDEQKLTTLFAGCIVADEDTASLARIKTSFTTGKTAYQEYIVSDFPLKGTMSLMFGMYKIYPKLNAYCTQNGYSTEEPVTEIYNRVDKKIHYRRKLVQVK
ncbi:MAG: hypothetical protein ACERKD_04200 [Prolixibacteraceae bacterium]